MGFSKGNACMCQGSRDLRGHSHWRRTWPGTSGEAAGRKPQQIGRPCLSFFPAHTRLQSADRTDFYTLGETFSFFEKRRKERRSEARRRRKTDAASLHREPSVKFFKWAKWKMTKAAKAKEKNNNKKSRNKMAELKRWRSQGPMTKQSERKRVCF